MEEKRDAFLILYDLSGIGENGGAFFVAELWKLWYN